LTDFGKTLERQSTKSRGRHREQGSVQWQWQSKEVAESNWDCSKLENPDFPIRCVEEPTRRQDGGFRRGYCTYILMYTHALVVGIGEWKDHEKWGLIGSQGGEGRV
jgi:hypothetical protein